MGYKLSNGEYIKDGEGKLVTVEYIEELVQNAALALTAKRGRFYPDKNFGSRLSGLNREPFEEYAAAFIRQALYDLDGVFVKKVIKNEENIEVILIINDEEKEVILPIEQEI